MLALWVLVATSCWGFGLVNAQPSPQVQERISAAIKKAASLPADKVDYTEFVNVFIGTDNFGDVWYATVDRAQDEKRLNISMQSGCFCTIRHGLLHPLECR